MTSTSNQIRNYGCRTPTQVLQRILGLFRTYEHAYGYFGTQGFNRPGTSNRRTVLLVDGYYLNNAVSDQDAIGTDSSKETLS